jgi:hypothetical protein
MITNCIMIRTQISLTVEEDRAARREAKRLGISFAELIRRSVRSIRPVDDSMPWMRYAGMIESGGLAIEPADRRDRLWPKAMRPTSTHRRSLPLSTDRLGKCVAEQFAQLVSRDGFGVQSRTDPRSQGNQVLVPQEFR